MAKPGSPPQKSELENGVKTYKQALLQPAHGARSVKSQTRVKRFWRKVGGDNTEAGRLNRSEIVRLKITTLRAASSPSNPICFKCGDRGHLAPLCRNAILCFVCNRLGHKALQCRATTEIPDQRRANPRTIPQSKPDSLTTMQPLRPPIRTFHPTPASDRLEAAFRRSIILTDVEEWGPDRVQVALHNSFSHDRWTVRVFDEFVYLIETPSQYWFDSATSAGSVTLDKKQFPVIPWDTGFAEGMNLVSVWVKIRNFPMMKWQRPEFEALFSDFGAIVYELDPGTANQTDWRYARVRIGICDPKLLPQSQWVKYRNADGYETRYDVYFEVENAVGGENRGWQPEPGHKPGKQRFGTRPPSGPGSSSSRPHAPKSTSGPGVSSTPGGPNASRPVTGIKIGAEQQKNSSQQPNNSKTPTGTDTGKSVLVEHDDDLLEDSDTESLSHFLQEIDRVTGDRNAKPEITSPISVNAIKLTAGTSHPGSAQTPKRSKIPMAEPRRSVRLRVSGLSHIAIADKAKERKDKGSCSRGMILFDHYPFSRFTDKEIIEMFSVYNLHFGEDVSQHERIISSIRKLGRPAFEELFSHMITTSRINETSYQIRIDDNTLGLISLQ